MQNRQSLIRELFSRPKYSSIPDNIHLFFKANIKHLPSVPFLYLHCTYDI